MKIRDWLAQSTQTLLANDVATARLDSLVLLEDIVRQDRALLLAQPEFKITRAQLKVLNDQVERRARHEPLAYIRGKSEFYGRQFKVSPDTLQPRPESETLIELLKTFVKPTRRQILVDIGTGSGALAITAKLEHPTLQIVATEISTTALKIAKQNAKTHHVIISFSKGDLVEPLAHCPDIILANLPYVPDSHTINPAAMQEPRIAIFGGPNGLDVYQQLFEQLQTKMWTVGHILTEALPPQHQQLRQLARQYNYIQAKQQDFIQVFEPRD